MSDPVFRLNAALEGRYTIVRELGEGGMATVYLAEDIKHNRRVALKVFASAQDFVRAWVALGLLVIQLIFSLSSPKQSELIPT
jgi:serine/threonine protein kinase